MSEESLQSEFDHNSGHYISNKIEELELTNKSLKIEKSLKINVWISEMKIQDNYNKIL